MVKTLPCVSISLKLRPVQHATCVTIILKLRYSMEVGLKNDATRAWIKEAARMNRLEHSVPAGAYLPVVNNCGK